jgi:hybrid cluster-associated redox disulfide protein
MITKNMIIADVIHKYPETVAVLSRLGIGCIGCIAGSHETLEQGLGAHGVDVDDVVKQMNEVVN